MELVAPNKNIVNLNWLSGKILLWLFLILATLNLSTGAVIVLVASGPNGELLDGDATSVPTSEIRLLHLELFGGIVHLHTTTSGAQNRVAPILKVIDNDRIVSSLNLLFSTSSAYASAGAADHTGANQVSFSHATLSGEKPDPSGLMKGDKVITSSDTEGGLSRVFSPSFVAPEKPTTLVDFVQISHPLIASQPDWPGTFPYPPEKPPKRLG